ncbi:unnamed protein product [Pieris macdunnoughi]|uniref:Uncharacterized protein n=1 Tax=Pieris macdunnoughi TaxID=345717 RepID=A0A821MW17_9NEOP|nr:unnamed protein product [Pieris macdunnoughi]
MEVADQWRRQWAGTAEFGKVTEGGVTRRVARAMEVLHASAPGAKVRVMRAAYHSSSGPGAPSSSYLMHSSRRVISSGYLPEQSPALPSKPLEISSLPLESSPEVDSEKLNYKVTEPDDIEISEPSKWRITTGKSSIRMPSEESSSTDNASIIDLDSRNSSRNTTRSFRNSESNEDSIKNIHVRNHRVSPLLDAPVSLSTLKYTSLLNGSDEWNNRRKSYSFEDTTTLNSKSGDTLNIMDSSTDSGICKSTEIVSDYNTHHFENMSMRRSKERLSDLPEESFQEWLWKNRPTSTFKPTRISPLKEHHEKYLTDDNNIISLQSKGKVTITLPVTVEDDDPSSMLTSDDNDKRTKRVGFCKTELHFAAESGTVNIIATDEKPPPSNDFRRKKSVFAPYTSKVDKSITLFGEKSSFRDVPISIDKQECADLDDNIAATKSILKNRIPKPRPYLLGENMALGDSTEDKYTENSTFPTAVTLINRQFDIEQKQTKFYSNRATDEETYSNHLRTPSIGPQKHIQSLNGKNTAETIKSMNASNREEHEHKSTSLAPTGGKFKTRQLRDSDLTFFGIQNNRNNEEIQTLDNLQEEILHSVKLVQKISNSVCNSEAESDDTPEYQNISNIKYRPVPTPKPRTKYIEVSEDNRNKLLKPISEADSDVPKTTRSARLKTTHESASSTSRSLSESPRKDSHVTRNKVCETSPKRSTSMNRNQSGSVDKYKGHPNTKRKSANKTPEETVYVNINAKKDTSKHYLGGRNSPTKLKLNSDNIEVTTTRNYEVTKNKQTKSDDRKPKRTEKLTTPDLSTSRNEDIKAERSKTSQSAKFHNRSTETNQKSKNYIEGNKEVHRNGYIHNSEKAFTKDKSKRPSDHISRLATKTNPSPDKLKSKEPAATERNSSKSRKSKYVINYDDKNGTVSSICKIKPSPDSLRKEPVQNLPTTDKKVKSRKSGFLQTPDHHWLSGVNTKTHARKTCQLL